MLKIALKDGERLVVNGAVVRAVGRTVLAFDSKAAILRARDMISPEDANTPARRLYFACMAAYTDIDRRVSLQDEIVEALRAVVTTMTTPAARAAAAAFAHRIAGGDHYRALADCRALIAMEELPPQVATP